ncbi:hypothetical protein K1719_024147 [Acacia pycnantha]|nr:hypothetical protein K1719_024147 [Acacia pycnantha]
MSPRRFYRLQLEKKSLQRFWDANDKMMMELHSHGGTIEEIEEVLEKIPSHPRVVPTVKAAHALGFIQDYTGS